MKQILLSILAVFSFMPATAQNVCTVKGEMGGFDDNTLVYMLRRTGEFTRDTVMQTVINGGYFSFEVPSSMWHEQYELRFGKERFSVASFAEEGDVVVKGDKTNLMNVNATGTADNDLWNEYKQHCQRLAYAQNKRFGEIRAMNVSDSLKKAMSAKAFQESQQQQLIIRDSLAKAHPASVAALYLYYQTLPLLKGEQIKCILRMFSDKLASCRYYKEMKAQADLLATLSVGVTAPDFEVVTPEGGKIKLSSFRGKPLILDFWASWCAPCRKETVYIKKIYEKYRDKGLQVFSVSLDDNKEAWVKAIKEDGMPWNHGCQLLKGGKNTPVAKLYGIDGIPAIWVIDANGVILAEGVREQALVDFCDSLF